MPRVRKSSPAGRVPRCPGCAAARGAATGTAAALRARRQAARRGARLDPAPGLCSGRRRLYKSSRPSWTGHCATWASSGPGRTLPPGQLQDPAPADVPPAPTGIGHVGPRLAPRRREVGVVPPLLHYVEPSGDAVLLARDWEVPGDLCCRVGGRLGDLLGGAGADGSRGRAGGSRGPKGCRRHRRRRRRWDADLRAPRGHGSRRDEAAGGRQAAGEHGGRGVAAATLSLRRSVTNVSASQPSRKPLRGRVGTSRGGGSGRGWGRLCQRGTAAAARFGQSKSRRARSPRRKGRARAAQAKPCRTPRRRGALRRAARTCRPLCGWRGARPRAPSPAGRTASTPGCGSCLSTAAASCATAAQPRRRRRRRSWRPGGWGRRGAGAAAAARRHAAAGGWVCCVLRRCSCGGGCA